MFVINYTLKLQKRPKRTIKHLETPSQTDLRLRHPTPLSPSTPASDLTDPRAPARPWSWVATSEGSTNPIVRRPSSFGQTRKVR